MIEERGFEVTPERVDLLMTLRWPKCVHWNTVTLRSSVVDMSVTDPSDMPGGLVMFGDGAPQAPWRSGRSPRD